MWEDLPPPPILCHHGEARRSANRTLTCSTGRPMNYPLWGSLHPPWRTEDPNFLEVHRREDERSTFLRLLVNFAWNPSLPQIVAAIAADPDPPLTGVLHPVIVRRRLGDYYSVWHTYRAFYICYCSPLMMRLRHSKDEYRLHDNKRLIYDGNLLTVWMGISDRISLSYGFPEELQSDRCADKRSPVCQILNRFASRPRYSQLAAAKAADPGPSMMGANLVIVRRRARDLNMCHVSRAIYTCHCFFIGRHPSLCWNQELTPLRHDSGLFVWDPGDHNGGSKSICMGWSKSRVLSPLSCPYVGSESGVPPLGGSQAQGPPKN